MTTELSAAVVVATYNRTRELAELLASLARQSIPPAEVIVVDDGSTPPAVVDRPEGATFPLKVIRQANAGAAHARDAAIAHVESDVVIVVDDDMVVGPSFVEAHLARHALGATVVQAPFRHDGTDTPLHDRFTIRQHEEYFERCAVSEDALDPSRLTTGNVSFRAELYRRVGGFDTSLRRCEDRELGIRFAEAGAVIGFAADAVALHREQPEPIGRWLRVARDYGAAELAIARRHPFSLDPWGLFHEIPLPAQLVVRAALGSPWVIPVVVAILVLVGRTLERMQLAGLALKAYGMAFALSWFEGLFGAFDSRAEADRSLQDAVERANGPRRVMFGQVGVDIVDMDEAVERTIELATSGEGGVVVTPNVDHLMLYGRESGFASLYDRADLVLADGMPLVLVSRVLFLPLRHKVSGSDFVEPLMGAAARQGIRVFLLGASDETSTVAEERLHERHPDLIVVGRSSPWYDPGHDSEEMRAAIDLIRTSGAQLVIVAFGAPKQEQFLTEYGDVLPPACFVCCGAGLDFIAGAVQRAPRWMSNVGLEWTYRLAKEPGRLWKRYLLRDAGAIALFRRPSQG